MKLGDIDICTAIFVFSLNVVLIMWMPSSLSVSDDVSIAVNNKKMSTSNAIKEEAASIGSYEDVISSMPRCLAYKSIGLHEINRSNIMCNRLPLD